MKFAKKLVGLLLATSLTCGMLVGCTSGTPEIDATATAVTVNGEDVSLGFADFYARYDQSYIETYYMIYYGEDMWESETDGVAYEDDYKDSIMSTIIQLYITKQYGEELGVSLTEEEQADILAVAEEMYNDNTEEQRAYASITVENIQTLLELYIMEERTRLEVIKAVDSEVSYEESLQKGATYVMVELTTEDEDGNDVDMTEGELAALEVELEVLIEFATDSGDLYTTAEELGYTVVEMTYNPDTTSYDADMCAELDTLSEGEFTGVIKGESYYLVAQLTSEYDEEASEAAAEAIIEEREDELYTEVLTEVIAAAEYTIYDEVWATVSFIDYGVTMYIESTEE